MSGLCEEQVKYLSIQPDSGQQTENHSPNTNEKNIRKMNKENSNELMARMHVHTSIDFIFSLSYPYIPIVTNNIVCWHSLISI